MFKFNRNIFNFDYFLVFGLFLLLSACPFMRFLGVFPPYGRILPDASLEIPVEGRDGRKARPRGDILNRLARRVKEVQRTVDAVAIDVFQRRNADHGCKHPPEMALAHHAAPRHLLDQNFLRIMP